MRSRTKYLFLLIAALWVTQYARLGAYPRSCAIVCTSSTDCNTLCYVALNDFINGIEATCLDYGVFDEENCHPTGWVAGDGTAGSGVGGTCGNGTCNSNETCDGCPQDCGSLCGSCGDSICAADEYGGANVFSHAPLCGPTDTWCEYCDSDCGECDPGYCWPRVCGGYSERYQCANCTSDFQCDYQADAWCATGRDGVCHTSCGDDYQCPYPKVCDLTQGQTQYKCIDPPLAGSD